MSEFTIETSDDIEALTPISRLECPYCGKDASVVGVKAREVSSCFSNPDAIYWHLRIEVHCTECHKWAAYRAQFALNDSLVKALGITDRIRSERIGEQTNRQHITALNSHLSDMRAIVASKLNVELPKG